MLDVKSLSLMTVLLVAAPTLAFASPLPVPEPSSLAILAAGVTGAALVKFRKRK